LKEVPFSVLVLRCKGSELFTIRLKQKKRDDNSFKT
jgi:hypothetical protein